MIGSCARTQVNSWDIQIEVIHGVLYDIMFDQNFASCCLNGQPIANIPVSSIISLVTERNQGMQFSRARALDKCDTDNRVLDFDDYEGRKVSKRKEKIQIERGMRKLEKALNSMGL